LPVFFYKFYNLCFSTHDAESGGIWSLQPLYLHKRNSDPTNISATNYFIIEETLEVQVDTSCNIHSYSLLVYII